MSNKSPSSPLPTGDLDHHLTYPFSARPHLLPQTGARSIVLCVLAQQRHRFPIGYNGPPHTHPKLLLSVDDHQPHCTSLDPLDPYPKQYPESSLPFFNSPPDRQTDRHRKCGKRRVTYQYAAYAVATRPKYVTSVIT